MSLTAATFGIVLRATKYGDTSLICKVFTGAFGIQSYIFKGVRNSKSAAKNPNILFPGAILDMIVYRYPNKSLNYVKEYHLEATFGQLQDSIVKNCIQMFCVEIMDNILIDDQEHVDIFEFYQSFLQELRTFSDHQLANAPLYFAIRVGKLAGYGIHENYSAVNYLFNPAEGAFSYHIGNSLYPLSKSDTSLLSALLKVANYRQISQIPMSNESRRNLMQAYLAFLEYHAPNFKEIKCLAVLQVILG